MFLFNSPISSCSLILICLASNITGRTLDSELEARVSRLEQRQEVLIDELSNFGEAVSTLDDNDGSNGSTDTSGTPTDSAETLPDTSHVTSPVHILSVARDASSSPSTITYRVRFIQVSPDVSIMIYISGERRDLEIQSTPTSNVSVSEFSVTKTRAGGHVVWIVGTSGYKNSIALLFNNNDTTDLEDDDVDVPLLEVIPQGDLVYTPGQQKVDFEVIANSSVDVMFNGVDLVTRKLIMYESVDFIEEVNTETYGEDLLKIFYSVDLSQRSVSGYLHISPRSTSGADDALVQGIYVTQLRMLRPVDQEGAFPPGFLDFVSKDKVTPWIQNDTVICQIDAGSNCSMSCTAVGETISRFRVLEILPNGSRQVIQQNTSGFEMFSESYDWSVTSDNQIPGSMRNFLCEAEDATHGTIATQSHSLMYATEGRFIDTLSNFTVEEDENNPSQKTVTLRCAFSGYPQPEVTFTLVFTNHVGNEEEPDSIVQVGQHEWLATKTVTFTNSDPWSDLENGELSNGLLESSTCYVSNLGMYGTYAHDYYMPTEDWREERYS